MNDDLRYYGNPMNWESTKGDLISREALKNALNYIYDCAYIDSKSKEGIASDIIAEIDNAPTVSFMISPDYVAGLQKHNKELIKQLEDVERPQDNLIHSLTELCNKYCENCPTMGEKPNPNDCTDCICIHIRRLIEENHEYKCEDCQHKDKCVRVSAFLMANVRPYSDGCENFEKGGAENG